MAFSAASATSAAGARKSSLIGTIVNVELHAVQAA